MRIDLVGLVAVLLLAALSPQFAAAQQVRVLVQSSPLAGFRYYAGEVLWQDMKIGDELVLVREPDNAHDANAVVADQGQLQPPRIGNPGGRRPTRGYRFA